MLPEILGFVQAHPFITSAIVIALVFDFVNGFHDSANAIATVIATKVMTPAQALAMAGIFNFLGPFVFSLAVATTIGKGIIATGAIAPALLPGVIFAALVGAIAWNLITWHVGLPSSSSHALVGGLIGAGLAVLGPSGVVMPTWDEILGIGKYAIIGALFGIGGALVAMGLSRLHLPRKALVPMTIVGAVALAALFVRGNGGPNFALGRHVLEWFFSFIVAAATGAFAMGILWVITQHKMDLTLLPPIMGFGAVVSLAVATLTGALKLGGITKTVLFMIVSPVLGFLAGFLLMAIVTWVTQGTEPSKGVTYSKRLQIVSSAFYALTHGTNDAQKTMGIIAVLLIAGGAVAADPAHFAIPTWVILSSALAMGLGTLLGGQRIIHTMATKITHLTPAQGFAASAAGGVVLAGMATAGIPVSTTHAISGSIMGVGATRGVSAVRWGVGRRIVGAWVFTIPASAVIAFVSYLVIKAIM